MRVRESGEGEGEREGKAGRAVGEATEKTRGSSVDRAITGVPSSAPTAVIKIRTVKMNEEREKETKEPKG